MNFKIISALKKIQKLSQKYYKDLSNENKVCSHTRSKLWYGIIIKAKEKHINKISEKLGNPVTIT